MQENHLLPTSVQNALIRQRLYALRRMLNNPRLDPARRCDYASEQLTLLFELDSHKTLANPQENSRNTNSQE